MHGFGLSTGARSSYQGPHTWRKKVTLLSEKLSADNNSTAGILWKGQFLFHLALRQFHPHCGKLSELCIHIKVVLRVSFKWPLWGWRCRAFAWGMRSTRFYSLAPHTKHKPTKATCWLVISLVKMMYLELCSTNFDSTVCFLVVYTQ